jgi:hypothetical protein
MKKIIILLLIIFPITINAATCDSNKHSEYQDYVNYIKMEKEYSSSLGTYTVTLYNVANGLTVVFNNDNYRPDSDSKIVISRVKQGTNTNAKIYGDDGCTNVAGTILINTPYFNKFYGSYECEDYIGKIAYCSSQFTSVKVTQDLLDTAINDYNMMNNNKKEEVPEESILPWYEKILEAVKIWGIKLALVLISSFGTIMLFNQKFRKLEHGI